MPRVRLPVMEPVVFSRLARGLGVNTLTQRQAARVAALMYGTGSGLVYATLLLPHDEGLKFPVVLGVAVLATATALVFGLYGERMAPSRFWLANLGGSVLISILVAVGGSDSTAYAMLYVWAAIYAVYFFEGRHAAAAAAWIVVCSAVGEFVRVAQPAQSSTSSAWLMAVGTSGVAAVVILDLVRRLLSTLSIDPLTGAANRGSWDEQVVRSIALARRQALSLSVLMIDLDHFKVYNDDHGHQAGDTLLAATVKAWRREMRAADYLARYGGEEFAFLLAGCDAAAAGVLGERLRSVMPAGQTCSIGVAELEPGDDATSLVARADAALYAAKTLGRDRLVSAGAAAGIGDRDALAETSRWAKTVQAVLSSGESAIAYQPIRRLDSPTLLGFEALARPLEEGVTVEGLFVTAQRMGRMRELDWLCRRSALQGVSALPPGALIFINAGVGSLIEDPDAPARMLQLANGAGVDPRRVVLEVTERETVLQPARLAAVLAEHRRLGFQVAVDDVGQGHSTFELLASIVPDYVKIARSLVTRLDQAGPRSAIMAAVMFANASGAKLIAEGIEDPATATQLHFLGAHFGQGFHLGRPLITEPGRAQRAAAMYAETTIMPSPYAIADSA